MSYRPGYGTLAIQRQRTHRWCNLYEVVRRDGVVLRFTDCSEPIAFGGRTYSPVGGGSASAEDRENQKESEMELVGALSADVITADDIEAGKYRGAVLRRKVIPYDYPLLTFATMTYRLQDPQVSGASWKVSAKGLSTRLQTKVGRIVTSECDYVLGDPHTCRADLTAMQIDDVAVVAVSDDRTTFDMDSTDVSASFADGYFQEGLITWRTGNNANGKSVIGSYTTANRRVVLYLPTRSAIQVGDTLYLQPGCDGTAATCKAKFANLDNFGGDPFTPGTKQVMKAPQ